MTQPIVLDGSYEVALTEITYSSYVKVDFGILEVFDCFSKQYTAIPLVTHNGEKAINFVNNLNNQIRTGLIANEYMRRYNLIFKSDLVLNKTIMKKSDKEFIIRDYEKSPNREIYEKFGGVFESAKFKFESIDGLVGELKDFEIKIVPNLISEKAEYLETHLLLEGRNKPFNDCHAELEIMYDRCLFFPLFFKF